MVTGLLILERVLEKWVQLPCQLFFSRSASRLLTINGDVFISKSKLFITKTLAKTVRFSKKPLKNCALFSLHITPYP
jgi:hypothetical protein